MKILQISKLYYPWIGGVEQHVRDLAEGIQLREEVEVLVCAAKGKGRRETVHGVSVTRAGAIGMFFGMPLSFSFPLLLRKKAVSADMLHLHSPFPLGELAVLLFFSKGRKKIAVTYHSDIVRQKFFLALYRPFLKKFLERADMIFVTSPNLLKHSSFLGPVREKCKVVPLFIDIEAFEKRIPKEVPFSNARNQRIILFVGRLVYYKGLEYLIEAMKNVDALLLIVGGGPLEKDLKKRASELGVSSKVHFLGKLSDEEVKYCYGTCDIFVLPSIEKTEAFGLVQLEAMLSRKPVVNTALPTGVPFVSLHRETGLTVALKDAQALSRAIQYLLSNTRVAKLYGDQGYQRARDLFAKDMAIEKVIQMYKTLNLSP